MIELEFVEFLPPRAGHANSSIPMVERYAEHMALLRTKPGVWAIIARDVPSTQLSQLRKTADKTFEWANRDNTHDGNGRKRRATLYGRFIGSEMKVSSVQAMVRGSKVLKCRSQGCAFMCEIDEMAKMTHHTRSIHDRQATQAERSPREM